jgi:glycerol-3-phosphate dehydrogenase subunit C
MSFIDAADRTYPAFSTDACIKCNVCTTVCPVARVTDDFPGPKYVGPQAQRFRGARVPDITVDLCSGCGYCTRACPAGVLVAETNSRARARIVSERGTSLRNRVISDTDLLIRFGVPFAPLVNFGMRNRLARWVGEIVSGVHRRAAVHPFARRTFRSWWRRRRPIATDAGPEKTLVYFHGCAVNGFETSLGRDAVEVLERNGFTVIVPDQVCCGLPMISNGLYADARKKAHRNLRTLADYARRGYRIVATSTSCGYTLKAEYHEMLDLDDEEARAVAHATWDICELLSNLHDEGKLDTRLGPLKRDLPYHPPCQLKGHGIGTPAMDLFGLIPGLRAVESNHDCCGAAGTYGLKKERWQIAQDVGRGLFEKVRASGAPDAACDSETCRWQITSFTGLPSHHPIEYLAESYRVYDAAATSGPARWRTLWTTTGLSSRG